MSVTDHGADRPAEHDGRVGALWRPATGPPPDSTPALDEALAAMLPRAARIGIPAWRVRVALGMPLPPGDE